MCLLGQKVAPPTLTTAKCSARPTIGQRGISDTKCNDNGKSMRYNYKEIFSTIEYKMLVWYGYDYKIQISEYKKLLFYFL